MNNMLMKSQNTSEQTETRHVLPSLLEYDLDSKQGTVIYHERS